MQSRKVRVDQLDIHYLSGGEGDPLIVIHGGAEGANAWEASARELSKHYRVYIPDLPGFGQSQAMGGFSLSRYAAFLDEFTRKLGIKRFHLMGHSLGGGIALQYALRFPHRVQRLVLVDSLCLGKEIAMWIRFASSPVFSRYLGGCFLTVIELLKRVVGWCYKPVECMDPVSRVKIDIANSLLAFKGQTTVFLNHLSDLLMPTLVIWGSNDPIVPVTQAYVASRLIPDCQLHVFEHCGHSVYREEIADFSHLLVGFLGKSDPS